MPTDNINAATDGPAVRAEPGDSPARALPVGSPPAGGTRSKGVLGRLLSALRGDKYMVGAYPPEWHDAGAAAHQPPAATTPADPPHTGAA